MKNYELFEIAQRISTVLPSLDKIKGAKFHYALLKNIDVLQKELDLIQTKSKPSEKFTQYEQLRVALCEQYAAKDENGVAKKRDLGNGQTEFDIDTESADWKSAIEKLKSENSGVITEREEQIKHYNDLLEVDSMVKFHLIKLEDIPDEVDGEQMQALRFWIQ